MTLQFVQSQLQGHLHHGVWTDAEFFALYSSQILVDNVIQGQSPYPFVILSNSPINFLLHRRVDHKIESFQRGRTRRKTGNFLGMESWLPLDILLYILERQNDLIVFQLVWLTKIF